MGHPVVNVTYRLTAVTAAYSTYKATSVAVLHGVFKNSNPATHPFKFKSRLVVASRHHVASAAVLSILFCY